MGVGDVDDVVHEGYVGKLGCWEGVPRGMEGVMGFQGDG